MSATINSEYLNDYNGDFRHLFPVNLCESWYYLKANRIAPFNAADDLPFIKNYLFTLRYITYTAGTPYLKMTSTNRSKK
jgi:hypothetical protein